MHARAAIRSVVVAKLNAVSGLAGHVTSSSTHVFSALPCANVTTPRESRDGPQKDQVQHRSLEIVVELFSKASGNIDDALDNLAVLAETAIAADSKLSGYVKDLRLESSELELVTEEVGDGELEVKAGKLTQTWAALYRVNTASPEAIAP